MQRQERRAAQRVSISKPLVVMGTNSHGESFRQESVSINMSSSGIYFVLDQSVDERAVLDVSIIEREERRSSWHKASGRVVRRDQVTRHGLSGLDLPTTCVAVEFLQRLQISLDSSQSAHEPSVPRPSLKMAAGQTSAGARPSSPEGKPRVS